MRKGGRGAQDRGSEARTVGSDGWGKIRVYLDILRAPGSDKAFEDLGIRETRMRHQLARNSYRSCVR